MTLGSLLCGWGWTVAVVLIACLVSFIHTQLVFRRNRDDPKSPRR